MKPDEQTAAEMVEKAQTGDVPEPELTPLPPTLVRRLQAIQQRSNEAVFNLLQGYFDSKDLDIDRDHVTVDIQAGTWRLGKPRE